MRNRLAVLGSPIGHSQSPLIHSAAYAALGLNWSYERCEVGEGALANFLSACGPEWRGLSLTMPLKVEALALAHELDTAARITGAVNTVLFRMVDGTRQVIGFNTDVAGIVNSLAENGITRASRVLILGGGATAGSAIMAAAELGAECVRVAVRTPAKAEALRPVAVQAGVALEIGTLQNVVHSASDADLIISTLPGGSQPGIVFSADVIRQTPLYDVAYSPWPSTVGAQWQAIDAHVISGLGMLLHQALVQVRIFVSGDPFAELPNESEVFAAMCAAVGS